MNISQLFFLLIFVSSNILSTLFSYVQMEPKFKFLGFLNWNLPNYVTITISERHLSSSQHYQTKLHRKEQ